MKGRTFIDQLGEPIILSGPSQRIISLVPSQTELLADLGLADRVVGITKFCVHPEPWRKSKAIVGGTKSFRFDVIDSLKPDLIIGNKEENYQEGIAKLRKRYPVWISDIFNLTDSLNMIAQLGSVTETEAKAQDISEGIKQSFNALEKLPALETLYLIWREPWMGAASNTFIHEMMQLAGLRNCLGELKRYPELDHSTVKNLNPELVLLSSEPYPFSEKHVEEVRALWPGVRVVLVDGEMFSWYGSRLLQFSQYIQSLKKLLL